MIIPKQLTKGDIIGIYSPSGSVTYNPNETAMYESGLKALQHRGYQIKEGNFARHRYYHMSAPAKDKAADIHDLFKDPEVVAIIPSVGGHTASQILPYLDLDLIQKHPKIFVGFSDSAVLGMYIAAQTGLITYHSAVDVMFGFSRFGTSDCPMQNKGQYTTDCFWEMLEQGQVFSDKFSPWVAISDGECSGTILGGNLKGIQALIGTPFEPNWDGVILYWEAADAPHVIAQTLAHLKNAKVLNRIAGMVVGKVSHLKETFYAADEVMPVHEFIRYLMEGIDIPIIAECDIGHDVENITIPNGCPAHLEVKNGDCKLSFLYG